MLKTKLLNNDSTTEEHEARGAQDAFELTASAAGSPGLSEGPTPALRSLPNVYERPRRPPTAPLHHQQASRYATMTTRARDCARLKSAAV